MNLFGAAKISLAWNFLGTLLRSILGLAQLALLARYFDAAELGTYSQFFIISSLMLMLTECGLSAAAINKGELTAKQQHQLGLMFLLNGIVAALILFFSAPYLARLFENTALAPLLMWYAPVVILLAMGHNAATLCQQRLAFKTLVKAETLSVLAGFLVLFAGIEQGMGTYAIVMGLAANYGVRFCLLQWRVKVLALNILRLDWRSMGAWYKFGWNVTGSNVLSFAVTSLDIVLISRLLGVEKTGQYGLIRDLVFRIATLLNPVLTRVALPFYAKLQLHPKLGSIYCQVKEILCYLTVPIYSFFIIFPELSIEILLGPQWAHLALLLQILAAWMIIRSVMSQSGSLLSALGRVKEALHWNILMVFIVPLGIWLGSLYDLLGVAVAVLLLQLLLYLPHWYFQLNRFATMSIRAYLLALLWPLTASFSSLLIVRWLEAWLPMSSLAKLLVLIGAAAILYLAFIFKRLTRQYHRLRLLLE